MMDMPLSRVDQFLHWQRTMRMNSDIDGVMAATNEVVDYLRKLIEARRAPLGEDVIGFVLKAEMQGRKLTDDELMGLCFNLYID
jgi:cytochrome P450